MQKTTFKNLEDFGKDIIEKLYLGSEQRTASKLYQFSNTFTCKEKYDGKGCVTFNKWLKIP